FSPYHARFLTLFPLHRCYPLLTRGVASLTSVGHDGAGASRGRPPGPLRSDSVGVHRMAVPSVSVVPFETARLAGVDPERIEDFCRRHHVARLSLFGSILRDDFTPESDVDVLVEFEPGRTPGLEFFGMGDELSEIIGRRVDLNTPGFLSRHFREEILAEARP